ncbi:MAG: DUF192 domain-containing protein [Alphaproteobacteria bacterium]
MIRVAAALFAFLLLAGHTGPTRAVESFEWSELVVETADGPRTFRVELAVSPRQQAQGLMFRRQMDADAGMLFPYDRPQKVSFWMKNTFIPLDMLFIAADGTIESIRERTVPHSEEPVRSKGAVKAVLELNSGTASRLDIKPGDRVRHAIFGD